MRFDSLTFILFLAIVLLLYAAVWQWAARKYLLLFASYLFYAAWNPPFVALLLISTGVDFVAARRMANCDREESRRLWLILSLVSNLGMLSFFKYGSFLLENFSQASAALGMQYQPAQFDIVLPIGISFYTFQTLSYTIDVYRRKIEPTGKFSDFALFVTFFPQLVAGPIVRAADFLPQLQNPKNLHFNALAWGAALLIIGLFYKQVLSDALFAPIADQVFDLREAPSTLTAWAGVFAFTGQIFCDFAGYSIMAIGVARMFGFTLPDNFNAPYAALGFSDFWRRWHISLSTWLRDYLYVSLGGNRLGKFATARNLFITMLLGGLWHGAAWTFVIWGALHGVYLVVERSLRDRYPLFFSSSALVNKAIIGATTLLLVMIAWVPFRARSFDFAARMLSSMSGIGTGTAVLPALDIAGAVIGCLALVGAQWCFRDQKSFSGTVAALPSWLLGLLLGCAIWLIVTVPASDRAFIYFQF